jgi:hypothetical protein
MAPCPLIPRGDGHAADTQTYLAHLAAVRASLQVETPLVVGERKLRSRPNGLGFCRVGAACIGLSSLSTAARAVLRRAGAAGAPPTVGRAWGLLPQAPRGDPADGRRSPLRRRFVHSLDDRRGVRHPRATGLARARRARWTLQHRLGHPA